MTAFFDIPKFSLTSKAFLQVVFAIAAIILAEGAQRISLPSVRKQIHLIFIFTFEEEVVIADRIATIRKNNNNRIFASWSRRKSPGAVLYAFDILTTNNRIKICTRFRFNNDVIVHLGMLVSLQIIERHAESIVLLRCRRLCYCSDIAYARARIRRRSAWTATLLIGRRTARCATRTGTRQLLARTRRRTSLILSNNGQITLHMSKVFIPISEALAIFCFLKNIICTRRRCGLVILNSFRFFTYRSILLCIGKRHRIFAWFWFGFDQQPSIHITEVLIPTSKALAIGSRFRILRSNSSPTLIHNLRIKQWFSIFRLGVDNQLTIQSIEKDIVTILT